MEKFNVRSKVGWGMHVVETPEDREDKEFFPVITGDPPPYGAMSYRKMLEGILVPADHTRLNSPGWIGDIQLIDYKRVWVEIGFAGQGVGSPDAFDPLELIPQADDEAREEVFLLNPLGKPIGYVKPWAGNLAEKSEAPIDRILALNVPKLLKYVLWYSEKKNGKRRAGLFIIEGNKPFEKMIEVYEQTNPSFCQRLREFIKRRNTPLGR